MSTTTDNRRGLRVVPAHGAGRGRLAHLGWAIALVDGDDGRDVAGVLDVLDRLEPSSAAVLVERLRVLLRPREGARLAVCVLVPVDGGFEVAVRGDVRVVGDGPDGIEELEAPDDEWLVARLDRASFVTAASGDQDPAVDDTLDLRRGIVAADSVVVLAPATDRPAPEVELVAAVAADGPGDDEMTLGEEDETPGPPAAVLFDPAEEDERPTTIAGYGDVAERAGAAEERALAGVAEPETDEVDAEPLPAPPPPFAAAAPPPGAPIRPPTEEDDEPRPPSVGSVPSLPGLRVPSSPLVPPGPAPSAPAPPPPFAPSAEDAPSPFAPPVEDAPSPFAPSAEGASSGPPPMGPPPGPAPAGAPPAPALFTPPEPAADHGAPPPAPPPFSADAPPAPFAPSPDDAPIEPAAHEAPAPPPPFAAPPEPAGRGEAPPPFAPGLAPAEPPPPFDAAAASPSPEPPFAAAAHQDQAPAPPRFGPADDHHDDHDDPRDHPEPAEPPAPAPDNVVSLIALETAPRRPLPIAGEADSLVAGDEVVGVMCSRGHFNDPRSRYCGHCGIAMLQASVVPTRGPRPPLGVLVFGTGEAIPLRRDIVIGRDAASDPRVIAGDAEPIVPAGDVRTLSRVHAELRLKDWDVVLIDRNSSNGTFTRTAAAPSWDRVEAGVPIELRPGLRVAFGHIVAVFESSLRQT